MYLVGILDACMCRTSLCVSWYGTSDCLNWRCFIRAVCRYMYMYLNFCSPKFPKPTVFFTQTHLRPPKPDSFVRSVTRKLLKIKTVAACSVSVWFQVCDHCCIQSRTRGRSAWAGRAPATTSHTTATNTTSSAPCWPASAYTTFSSGKWWVQSVTQLVTEFDVKYGSCYWVPTLYGDKSVVMIL